MNQSPEISSIGDYLRVIKERRTIVVVCTLIAAGAAFAYSTLQETKYVAASTVSFDDPSEQVSALVGQSSADFFPRDEAAAGAELVTRPDVLRAASRGLKSTPSVEELEESIKTEIDPESNLVSIVAEAGSGEQAAGIANAVARQVQTVTREEARDFFTERLAALQGDPLNAAVRVRLRTLTALAEPVEIVREAEVPESPAAPKPLRNTLMAAVIGLLLGIGAAFLRHALDKRLSDPNEIQRQLAFPLVGYVRGDQMGETHASANGHSSVVENHLDAFRILRTNVNFLAGEKEVRSMVVTSALPEEGKSTVADGLAYASAMAGRMTLLVEADMRRPVVAKRMGLDASPGLSDFLSGEATPKQVLRGVAVSGGPNAADTLAVVPAGNPVLQPTELLGSDRFRTFIGQVTRAYDLVVIDTTPLLPVGDTLEVLSLVDAILLCVRLEQTTRDQAEMAKTAIQRFPERPTGLIVTGLRPGSDSDYYGYYSERVQLPG